MNAKQVEQLTGISRRNLRFYEQQGLISPERNPENDYRAYSQKDVETLKLIRVLRMLDTPLEDIAACLHQEITVAELSAAQEQRLKQRQKEVENSLRFCRELQKAPSINDRYIDSLLTQMDAPEVKRTLFDDWKKDYQKVASAEARKAFTFTPDDAITTPAEFTDVLCRYGTEHNLNLVITKEGLSPEFEIDGIAYTAQRIYRKMGPVPVMVVRCTALHPEQLETDVPSGRKKVMKLFHNWWLYLLFLLIWIPRVLDAKPGKQWEVLLAGGTLFIAIIAMSWVFHSYRE